MSKKEIKRLNFPIWMKYLASVDGKKVISRVGEEWASSSNRYAPFKLLFQEGLINFKKRDDRSKIVILTKKGEEVVKCLKKVM